ncbi:MAG: NAD(P)H-quinone oxidoreductase [Dehalococcoidia bacterium]|nr:MAG: NAD(P)H-quinone oxidoreductase [Dehalococcoidia bacterium]
MRAAVVVRPEQVDAFDIQELPDPVIGPEEVLVAVKASALNRADLLQRRGRYNGPPGTRNDIPGLEMAGVIAETGSRVVGWKPGDRVMALLGGMGYASRIAVHERMLMPVPPNLTFEQAASIPEVFLTAYDALFLQCELKMGESVLIHAAGSGVGTAGIQMASAQGCRVFGTAGSQEKLEKAAALGLDVGIEYHTQDFAEVIKERTGGRGVDVILDVIGAPYWDQNIASLALKGRMVIVGSMGGGVVEQMNIGALSQKRASVRGTLLRARPLEEKATLVQAFVNRVLPLFANETLVPVVDVTFPLDQVGEAHRLMESNANFGKIVLTIED